MAVRSDRLCLVGGIAAGVTTSVFTCPAGRTAIVKQLVVQSVGGASPSTISVNVRSGSNVISFWTQQVAGTQSAEKSGLFVVLEPGDVLEVHLSGSAGTVRIMAAGALLMGTPS